jgi:hypothetical protein
MPSNYHTTVWTITTPEAFIATLPGLAVARTRYSDARSHAR